MTLSVLLSLVLVPVFAATPRAPIAFQKHTLSNGLTVILTENRGMGKAAMQIWFKVGSRDEEPGRTGFAHLFEHYMFEGSTHVNPGEYFKTIFGMGGITNATTSNDRTNYYAVVPAAGLPELIRQEADRMCCLILDDRRLDKQRGIVKEEKQLRENQPYGGLWEEINRARWPQGHPYQHPVIGFMPDLEAATLEDVRRFHSIYYVPNNATIVVAGDHDSAETLRLLKRYFEGIPRGAEIPATRPAIPSAPGRTVHTAVDPLAQLPMLTLAYRVPAANQPGSDEISVAADILGSGTNSRLVKKLQTELGMVLMIGAGYVDFHMEGMLMIRAIPAPGFTMEQVEAAIRAELDRFAASGPTPQEMARIRAVRDMEFRELAEKIENFAYNMAEANVLTGNPADVRAPLDRVLAMPLSGPQQAVRDHLTVPNTAVIVITPPASSAPAGARP